MLMNQCWPRWWTLLASTCLPTSLPGGWPYWSINNLHLVFLLSSLYWHLCSPYHSKSWLCWQATKVGERGIWFLNKGKAPTRRETLCQKLEVQPWQDRGGGGGEGGGWGGGGGDCRGAGWTGGGVQSAREGPEEHREGGGGAQPVWRLSTTAPKAWGTPLSTLPWQVGLW